MLAALVLLGGGAGAWLYMSLDGNIHSAGIKGKLGGDRPDNLSPGSKNILVVGSDSREGANAKYGKGLETMQSDTLMVMHLSADRKWAGVLSLPRDSYVPIPACDKGDGTTSEPHSFKINESFAIGGTTGDVTGAAACTIKTVEQNTGLRIDHFMSVDFQGFKGMVNALGGIEVCPKEPIDDKKAHLKLDAGCQTIRDEKALGYVRARYGVGDGSDTGRIGRQQEFMQALADKARQKLTSPKDLYGFLDSATKSLTTDEEIAGIKPLAELASSVQGIPSDRLHFLTVPNYPREADIPTDKANVVWQHPQAGKLFSDLARDREVTSKQLKAAASDKIYASQVRVQVLNGTKEPGAAAKAAGRLRKLGIPATTGNAAASADSTEITYPKGQRAQARILAAHIRGDVKPEAAAKAAAGQVTLVLGPDFKGVG
ncbi:LCP family protein [Streptomyces iconiensis]|uniref:LCP family protein n=1 Tax=Streptomyces iconiensis TaxID=1384038 RepID=A0ABT6ZPP0_9ACTN|nr:LCP family protein [Streptomyces iconiensis]MDJ1131020.1 LCP family protein [Streptomyces iconiensis]